MKKIHERKFLKLEFISDKWDGLSSAVIEARDIEEDKRYQLYYNFAKDDVEKIDKAWRKATSGTVNGKKYENIYDYAIKTSAPTVIFDENDEPVYFEFEFTNI